MSAEFAATRYAELHCVTNYSFLRGASHPEELVERAQVLGYAALAVTDECSIAGAVRAHVAARRLGLHLIVGSEFALSEGDRIIVLAATRSGYGALCRLITEARARAPKGRYALALSDLSDSLEGCFILWVPVRRDSNEVVGATLSERFAGRLRIAVELVCDGRDRERLKDLQALGEGLGVACVAAGDVHMHVRGRRALTDVLAALRHKTTLAVAGERLHTNGERHLRQRETLARLYPPGLLEESARIADHCMFSLSELRYEYPDEIVPEGATPTSYLAKLTRRGICWRWPSGAPPAVEKQIRHELALIAELGYEPFFLTVNDIVEFAHRHGILCQGRGSAANSAVCYALGITEVDPACSSMLFERFVSKERDEPPDIDVDFEHERREEVIQYIYQKYGRDRAALAATVITYRLKSALRDVGRVLGIVPDAIDRLAGTLAQWDNPGELAECIAEAGLDPDSPVVRRWLTLARRLVGFPRHLSQHVGGFVISRGPLSRLVPVEPAAMTERSVIQWDKDDLEALGLLKVDVLALGMLTALSRALKLVAVLRGRYFDMSDIPKEDPATYAMIRRGDTVGVFQIESRAQMAMLPRLKPRTFYDLVIEVAIVRPGPIQGEMVHPYLRRRKGLEPVSYPSPAVRGVLERTLGVPIFQEQVMQLAVVAAGFTPGEADALRRAMAAWRRNGNIESFRKRLMVGMAERGYAPAFAERLYNQIRGFGEYGFPESHAASFALLAYASSWLKCHEPEAFACALLNSQPMGFYAPAQIVIDARKHGIEVRSVDVTASDWECTLESTDSRPALRLGLSLVKGLTEAGARRLVRVRGERPFLDVADLGQRARLGRRDLAVLASAGALALLVGHRRRAHWEAAGAQEDGPVLTGARLVEDIPLLRAPGEGEDIICDYASIGLTLGRHPLELLRGRLGRERAVTAEAVGRWPEGGWVTTAGLVINRQRPQSASGAIFITLEDETGFINLLIWPAVVERNRRPVLGGSLLLVMGRVQRTEDVTHIVVERFEDRSRLLGDLQVDSRDFR